VYESAAGKFPFADLNGLQTMTAPQDPDEAQDRLAPLRPAYLRRLTLRQMEVALAAAIAAMRAFSEEELREIHRTAHSMGSSAAIYGHARLSEAARAAERILEDPTSMAEAKAACLERLAREAEAVLVSEQ
jgi:HPt (histidine-containing phosphotransfer) domain-containing protein